MKAIIEIMKLLWFLFYLVCGNKVDLYRTFGEALNELEKQNIRSTAMIEMQDFLINCNDRYKDTLMYEIEVSYRPHSTDICSWKPNSYF